MASAYHELLYVEDDAVNALLMEGIVALYPGCRLRVARDGAQACQAVAEGPVDLLLCDLRLPDVQGDQLLAQLHRCGLPRDVPALLVTAEPEALAAGLAQAGGFAGHWTKPLNVVAVLSGLSQWLR